MTRSGYRMIPADDPINQHGAIEDLLSRCFSNEPLCAWLEDPQREDGLQLRDNVSLDEAPWLMTGWSEGRLFSGSCDVRWERRQDFSLHVVVIGDQVDDGLALSGVVELDPVGRESRLILWGTRDDATGEWRETRMRDLTSLYPKTWRGPYAALAVHQYEAPWEFDTTAEPRRVTRYLGYIGEHKPDNLLASQ